MESGNSYKKGIDIDNNPSPEYMAATHFGVALNDAVFSKDPLTLNTVDVYSIAAIIGRDFEEITDQISGSLFGEVMPKIIFTLEALEAIVAKTQDSCFNETELSLKVEKLKTDSAHGNKNHQEELERMENAWREDTKRLIDSLQKVENDNKRLSDLVAEKLEEEHYSTPQMLERQDSIYQTLYDEIDKKKNEIKNKTTTIKEQAEEIDALTQQHDRISKLNSDIRKKVNVLEQQARKLITQNTQLESDINERKRQVKELQTRLQQQFPQQIQASEESHAEILEANNNCCHWPDPLMENKLVIDLSDPDRPRYTLSELQEVLNERNDFKLKYFLLEEEMAEYRGEVWEHLEEEDFKHEEVTSASSKRKPNTSESSIKRLFSPLFGADKKKKRVSFQIPTDPVEKVHVHDIQCTSTTSLPSNI